MTAPLFPLSPLFSELNDPQYFPFRQHFWSFWNVVLPVVHHGRVQEGQVLHVAMTLLVFYNLVMEEGIRHSLIIRSWVSANLPSHSAVACFSLCPWNRIYSSCSLFSQSSLQTSPGWEIFYILWQAPQWTTLSWCP